jgi:hypothetical protein
MVGGCIGTIMVIGIVMIPIFPLGSLYQIGQRDGGGQSIAYLTVALPIGGVLYLIRVWNLSRSPKWYRKF